MLPRLVLPFAFASSLLVAGCGGQVTHSGGGGGQCAGADCNQGGGGATGMGGSGGCAGADCNQGGGGAGMTGAPCGPMFEAPCPSDQYCDFPDDLCGQGQAGTCQKRPKADPECYPDFVDLTCGCDGKTDTSWCFLASMGQDVSNVGSCPTPDGSIVCGSVFCLPDFDYCKVEIGGAAGSQPHYSCASLPQGCGATPDCACLAGETCGASCEATPDGGLKVTCALP